LSLRQVGDGWSRYAEANDSANIRGLRTPPTSRLAGCRARRDPAPQPAQLPLQHTPQGSTAQEATEPLQRRTAGSAEALVTARSRAAKSFAGRGFVIALAGAFARRLWAAPLGGAGAPAARLLAAVASTLSAGAIALIGLPLRPPAGCLPTGCAAIARQRMPWLERPLTSLQQAETLSATRWGLPGRRRGIFSKWAQGRYCSRRSSLGVKRQLRTEATCCAAAS